MVTGLRQQCQRAWNLGEVGSETAMGTGMGFGWESEGWGQEWDLDGHGGETRMGKGFGIGLRDG